VFELRRHFITIAIVLPLVIIARYTLFENASEFGLFAQEMKRYVAPLAIALSVVAIVGLIAVATNKIDHLRQKRLSNIFFWTSSILLALAVAAVFAHVKLQDNQSLDETSRSVVIL
jgi:glucan phosphoethanolaminetransferase (alkaline phosphatase superfamily)